MNRPEYGQGWLDLAWLLLVMLLEPDVELLLSIQFLLLAVLSSLATGTLSGKY